MDGYRPKENYDNRQDILTNISSLVDIDIDVEIKKLQECGLSPYSCSSNADCSIHGYKTCKAAPPRCASRHPSYCEALHPTQQNILTNISSLVDIDIDVEVNKLQECGLSPYSCSSNADCSTHGYKTCKAAPPRCASRHPSYCEALHPTHDQILSNIESLVKLDIDVEINNLEKYGLTPYHCNENSECQNRGFKECRIAPPQCNATYPKYCGLS